ncbi:STAS domain-containing protein [endosymbiont of Lamellibrachia barhami]|uniref:STAS domain-containing protein n=1 Tax=endosymbiont of Lamellibrachia barhami TaxID=205975 RepID=UPI0015A82CA6|nr:STAS domain-containing protein [endosymbiont of Lamellibrachia barhami]
MTYLIEEKNDYLVVYLEGEVDLSCSPEARRVILDCLQKQRHLLVDLSGVSYIDSSGVASLVEGYQVSRSKNLNFALVGVSDNALNVLKLARLDQVFPIYTSIETLLQGGS